MGNASPPDDSSDSEQPSEDDDSWEQSNQELQEQLEQLIQEVCQLRTENAQFLAESAQGRKIKYHIRRLINRIQRLIHQSGRLRCDRSPHCEDCLQQIWSYFFGNLCEVDTDNYPKIKTPFCEEPRIIGRLKKRLNGCVKDTDEKAKKDLINREPLKNNGGKPPRDPVNEIPAPEPVILPTASLPPFLLNLVRAAVEADESGNLRRCHIENCPEANCQMLILQQLPPQSEWEALADELGLSILSLSSFYVQQCRLLLEKISEEQLISYVRAKIEADESGELRKCHVEDHPEVNCQVLILRRLPPEVIWRVLANEFDISQSTLSNFYRLQCKPQLKAICEPLLNQWQPEEES